MLDAVLCKKNIGIKVQDMIHALYHLTKPTITLLVVITTLPGILLASSSFPDLVVVIGILLGAGFASASAAVFNQTIEAGIDQQMERTNKRSLPTGKVSTMQAVCWGFFLLFLALLFFWGFATPLAAWVALAGHLFYVLVYTMYLKHRTVQNIVIGGAAGAVGPLIGWTAITGSFGWPAWVLFLIIFLWTPPHFWALAIKYKQDYAKVGIPMYPIIYGDHRTRKVILLYTLALLPVVVSLYLAQVAGLIYVLVGVGLTLKFIYDAFVLYRSENNARAMPLFHFSCLYTLGIFGALTIDRLVFLFSV